MSQFLLARVDEESLPMFMWTNIFAEKLAC